MADKAVDPLAEGARKVWSGGDWDAVSRLIAEVGPLLLDRVGGIDGLDLLDVGTGSGGTVAVPAAQRGARVVGSDITDHWFPQARERAAAAGVDVQWVEANVEDLPFPDGSFDVVTSTFGHMFAPHHAKAAAEMARVCRAGGVIATTAWRPIGYGGAKFALIGSFMPQPPEGVQPPPMWGVEEHVEAMFEPHGVRFEFRHEQITFHAPSADEFVEEYTRDFGPMVAARQALGEGWPGFEARFRALVAENAQRDENGIFLIQDYLVSIGRKTG